jgi:O-acetyl-ADP-ribose deacetylase (regulator of RNase III)
MKIVKQNILSVKEGIIAHQVNCLGVMGAGLAKAIKNKWPEVFEKYSEFCKSSTSRFGEILIIEAKPRLFIANLFGQYDYQKPHTYTQNTSYWALRNSLQKLQQFAKNNKAQVYLPYKIGCGLGGGIWEIVYEMIEDEIPSAIICQI